MKFSTEPVKKVEAKTPEVADLLAVQESIHQSWMDLDASIKQIDEVQQIMDNIDFSINAVTKYGADAIKVLNVDGSLENLLGVEEKLITAEKAVESLGDSMTEMWNKFVAWLKEVVAKIKAWMQKKFAFVKATAEDSVKKTEEIKQEVEAAKPKDPLKEGEVSCVDGGVILKLMADYEKVAHWYCNLEKECVNAIQNGDTEAVKKLEDTLVSTKWNGFATNGIEVGTGETTASGTFALRGIVYIPMTTAIFKPVTGTPRELHYTDDVIRAIGLMSMKLADLSDEDTGIIGAAMYIRMEQLRNESEKLPQEDKDARRKLREESDKVFKLRKYCGSLSEVGTTIIRNANRCLKTIAKPQSEEA